MTLQDILVQMERLRQEAEKCPRKFPIDWGLRKCQALVADYAGYENRAEWMEKLIREGKI